MKQLVLGLALAGLVGGAQAHDFKPKPASEATKAAHQKVIERLPFENTKDFELASRGLLKRPDQLVIKNAEGRVVWDMTGLDYLDNERPHTVNPSLWRQAQLNALYGLFEVEEGIYQVRGYDLANVTFIRGDTGWIVVDPLTATET